MASLSGIESIPVTNVDYPDADQAYNAPAVLNQLLNMLDHLLREDEPDSIDLRSLPLTSADYQVLREVLGEGEVMGTVTTFGPSLVYETGYSGVWWVTHQNEDDEVIGEFLEVTYCPEILISPQDDVREGREALRARLLNTELDQNAR